MKRKSVRVFGIAAAAVLAAGMLFGQQRHGRVEMAPGAEAGMKSINVTAFAPQGGTYTFIAAQAGMEAKVVKGSPYSAVGVTTTERILADGTKISKETSSKIYRDSQGRTRREMTLGAVGPWSAEGEAATTVTINDPVAGRMYVMHKGDHHAKAMDIVHAPHVELKELKDKDGNEVRHEVKILRKKVGGGEEAMDVEFDVDATSEANVWVHKEHVGGGEHVVQTHDLTAATGNRAFFISEDAGETEDLGERNIEGVIAKGTKTTQTIPEGKIGNDRPIKIVTEKWYSGELGALVMSKTDNPMSGNITYKLTNISRAEPDPSLFEMNEAEVEVHEGHSIERRIHVEKKVKSPEGM